MTSTVPPDLRVLLTVPTLGRGGAERMVIEIARGLQRRCIDCAICYFDTHRDLESELHRSGIPVEYLDLPHKAWPALFRLRCVVRSFKPTIIHAHMPRAAYWSSFVHGRVPLVYTEHNVQEAYPRWATHLFKRFLRHTALVTAVSLEARDSLVEKYAFPHSKCTVIRTGVCLDLAPVVSTAEIRHRHCIAPNELIVCAVGAVRPPKAYTYLVEATKLLLGAGIPVRTLIVGSTKTVPSEVERVRRAIERYGVQEKVQLLGEVESAFDYIAAADVFALSSVQEGLPRAILEAMVASKPVVATSVGGCAEAVVHGKTGLLVPPRDPKALAEAIRYIVTHPQEARRMGQAGREHVEKHFSIDVMIEKYIDLYRRALEETSRY